MTLIDEIKLYLKSGDGGNGCCSFRREKFIEFGGPDGGNGGKGGDISFIATKKYNSLYIFRNRKHIYAENGKSGSGYNKSGSSGKDIILELPLGTQLYDENHELLMDFNQENKQVTILIGGKGGVGNSNYKSSTNRAPRYFTFGEPGIERVVFLKLKIISDVGIIGLPNAGKSSFLRKCTNSKTKVADYPFTTLNPHLGIAHLENNQFITIADIPGLINGAHLGLGLGHRFLKHIERCKILLHLIDATQKDIIKTYHDIKKELSLYNPTLLEKHEVVALSKCDLLSNEEVINKQKILSDHIKKTVETISLNSENSKILKLLFHYTNKIAIKDGKNLSYIYDPYKNLR